MPVLIIFHLSYCLFFANANIESQNIGSDFQDERGFFSSTTEIRENPDTGNSLNTLPYYQSLFIPEHIHDKLLFQEYLKEGSFFPSTPKNLNKRDQTLKRPITSFKRKDYQLTQLSDELKKLRRVKRKIKKEIRNSIGGNKLLRDTIMATIIRDVFAGYEYDSLLDKSFYTNRDQRNLGVGYLKLFNKYVTIFESTKYLLRYRLRKKINRLLSDSGYLQHTDHKIAGFLNQARKDQYFNDSLRYKKSLFPKAPLHKKHCLTRINFPSENNGDKLRLRGTYKQFSLTWRPVSAFLNGSLPILDTVSTKETKGYLLEYAKKGDYTTSTFTPVNDGMVSKQDTANTPNKTEPISIADITVDGNKVSNNLHTLIVNSTFKTIVLTISNKDTIKGTKASVKYRIPSNDEDWLPVPPENKILISQISPGEHIIQVKTDAAENQEEKVDTLLHLSVLPKWHESIYFRLLLAALLCIILLLLIKRKIQKTERTNRELKRLVEGKTIELTDTIQHLKKSLEENELMLMTLSHDVLGPLNFSLWASQDLLSQWDELPDTKKKKTTKILSNSLQEMSFYVSDFLTWISFDSKSEIVLLEFNLLEFLKSIASRYSSHTNDIEFDCLEYLSIKTNKRILEIIVGNIFQNATKFTKHGTIKLSSYKKNEKIVISCKDTGQGMTSEQIHNLLSCTPVYTTDNKKSFGLGYRIINFFLPKIHGTLSINSELKKGTEVLLLID